MKKLFQTLCIVSAFLIFAISAAQAQDKPTKADEKNIDCLLEEAGNLPHAELDVSVSPLSFEVEQPATWKLWSACEHDIAPPLLINESPANIAPPLLEKLHIYTTHPAAHFPQFTLTNTASRCQGNVMPYDTSTRPIQTIEI